MSSTEANEQRLIVLMELNIKRLEELGFDPKSNYNGNYVVNYTIGTVEREITMKYSTHAWNYEFLNFANNVGKEQVRVYVESINSITK